jgi:hypothetical protein
MNRLTEEEKVLQEEVIKITDILEKEDLSDDKRKYLNDLKKYMADKMRGSRKPVKDLKKENILKGACNKILKNRLKKGGVNHNLSLVKGRLPPVAVDKELEKKQKEFIRKRMIMMNKTLKNQKLPTIPEYKGGKKKSMSRKTRKNKH